MKKTSPISPRRLISSHYRKLGYKGKYLDIRMKECKKYVITNLIATGIMLLIASFVLYSYYSGFLEDYMNSMTGSLVDPAMRKISDIYEEDGIIEGVYSLCSEFNNETKKIMCLHNFVKEFYYFDTHENESRIIRSPKEIINEGGCCRDYSIFYSSVLSLMGFDYDFIYEPEHVYLMAYGKENNYLIDQTYMEISSPDDFEGEC